MADYTKYTKQEMQAYAIAKNIKENQIVIVGTGLPLIGASLAKRVVCPSCHPIVESGLMDCSPVEVPRSVGDNRFMAHCAVQWPNIRFVEQSIRPLSTIGWQLGQTTRFARDAPINGRPVPTITI